MSRIFRTLVVQQRDAAAANAYNIYATQTMLNQNQQMINARNQPRMTNCQYVGAMLNCTTFYAANNLGTCTAYRSGLGFQPSSTVV